MKSTLVSLRYTLKQHFEKTLNLVHFIICVRRGTKRLSSPTHEVLTNNTLTQALIWIKKLIDVMKVSKTMLYTPLLKWHIRHGLEPTTMQNSIKIKSSRPYEWFAKELSVCNSGPMKRQLGHKYKVKDNCFYGKII